jgi:hypothetical protein
LARHRQQAELRRRGEPVAKTGPSPGLRDLKWPRPVYVGYVGDTVAFAQEIVELHAVTSRREVGLRIARHTGTNQHGELVYSVLSSTFIERRAPSLDGPQATFRRGVERLTPKRGYVARPSVPRASGSLAGAGPTVG